MRAAKNQPSHIRLAKDAAKPSVALGDLFRPAFYNSPALQSVVRASDATIVEVNETFLEKMGRTREQVIGKTPYELGSWVQPEKLDEYRRMLETHGVVRGFETQLRAENGTVYTMLLSSHPVQINGELHFMS